jgi:hypothetical protein
MAPPIVLQKELEINSAALAWWEAKRRFLNSKELSMHQCKSKFGWCVCLVLAGCLVPTAIYGQATGGTISGSVMDQSGATIPGAMIAIRNLETNVTRTTTTVENGRFNFPAVPVGQYELTVDLQGFSKYTRSPITLLLNQEAVVNVEIRPAGVQESVVVTDDVPILNTSTAEVGVQFDEKRLSELPISGQFAQGAGSVTCSPPFCPHPE